MKITLYEDSIVTLPCDTIVLAIAAATYQSDDFNRIDKAFHGYLTELIQHNVAYSEFGKTNVIHTLGNIAAKQLILVGMGNSDKITTDKIRDLMAIAVRSALTLQTKSLALSIGSHSATCEKIQAMVESIILGTYRFIEYKTEKAPIQPIEKLLLPNHNISKLADKLAETQIIAESVNFARDLVNHPACYMTPTKLAQLATDIAQEYQLEAIILEASQMKALQMDALLAVAQGSTQPPKMIAMKYMGNPTSDQTLAFVGKGITFDSGGISLKPSQNMDEMKDDMAGAATVLATMQAIAQLKPSINILAIMPCTENMPAGNALKPGDVISSMDGQTIEIISTDAEGRLILADAITYAKKLGATQIIDVATLTGACLVALGTIASGIITNDAGLCQQVLLASKQTGEKMWELPHFEEYAKLIKSDIADLKNSGGRLAGTITAGLFIGKFVGDTPWVHIDIAGTADLNETSGYRVKGATGVGVRTLVQLAHQMQDE